MIKSKGLSTWAESKALPEKRKTNVDTKKIRVKAPTGNEALLGDDAWVNG